MYTREKTKKDMNINTVFQCQNPLNTPKKKLAVDPYTLGVWLGDGYRAGTEITCSDEDYPEMMKHLTDENHSCVFHRNKNRAGFIELDSQGRGHKNPLRDALREIGVFKNKHIPEIYLLSSVEQRLALLQGLMDTDGTCSKSGQCSFTQKAKLLSMELANFFQVWESKTQ